MPRKLRLFLRDRSKKLVEHIVSIVLIVVIAGGLLVASLVAAQRIWEPLRVWLCTRLTLFCR